MAVMEVNTPQELCDLQNADYQKDPVAIMCLVRCETRSLGRTKEFEIGDVVTVLEDLRTIVRIE